MTEMPAPVNATPRRRWAPIAAMAAVAVLYTCIACTADSELGASDPRDAYYNLMVQGWLQGKASLSLEAPAGLRSLSDPYDPKANATYRGSVFYGPRVHDLSYFNGKMYAYFSPVPAVVAFLPYHLLTGRWLSHQQGCLLFCLAAFLCASGLSWRVRDRFFARVGDGTLASVVAALGVLSLGPILLQRPDVWEVPITCSQACWMLAIAAVWWGLHRPRPDWPSSLLAGVCAAMAVGSRPSSGLCGAILLIPALPILVLKGSGTRARRIGSFAALALPPIAVGGALLAFNHARFGEWLEFGQRYQLNADAARQSGSQNFSLAFLPYNLGLYAFHYRGWGGPFPFLKNLAYPPVPPGYGMVDYPVGMVANLPATVFVLALAVAWRPVPVALRRVYLVATGMVAWVGAAVAVPLLFYFGGCVRYEFEFAMYFGVLAGVGYLGLEAFTCGWARVLVRGAWCAMLAVSAAFCIFTAVSLRAGTLAMRGRNDYSRGSRAEAAEHLSAALRLQPSLVLARAMLGSVHIDEGDFSLAASDYARALEDEPDSAGLLFNYGYCLVRMGREAEAIAPLSRAAGIEPDSPEIAALLRYARQRESGGERAQGALTERP